MPNTTKEIGKMTPTFDQATYKSLLTEVVPRVIETEEEYDRALAMAERLTSQMNERRYNFRIGIDSQTQEEHVQSLLCSLERAFHLVCREDSA
jgi:hypothetical protein